MNVINENFMKRGKKLLGFLEGVGSWVVCGFWCFLFFKFLDLVYCFGSIL